MKKKKGQKKKKKKKKKEKQFDIWHSFSGMKEKVEKTKKNEYR